MFIMTCPNKSLIEYQELEKELGEIRALAAYHLNKDKIPTITQAHQLLNSRLLQIYHHADTPLDDKGLLSGPLGEGLSKEGWKEAKRIAQLPETKHLKTIYISDAQRAIDTANAYKNYNIELQIIQNPGLRTWDRGSYIGGKESAFPTAEYLEDKDKVVPGGESFNQYLNKYVPTIQSLRNIPEDAAILTHGDGIKTLKSLESGYGEFSNEVYLKEPTQDAAEKQVQKIRQFSTESAANNIPIPTSTLGGENSYVTPANNPEEGLNRVEPTQDIITPKEETSTNSDQSSQEDVHNQILAKTLNNIKTVFETRKDNPRDEIRQTSINQLKALINNIKELQQHNEQLEAFKKVMKYLKDITKSSSDFINNPNMFGHKLYYQFLQESVLLSKNNINLLPETLRKILAEPLKTEFDDLREDLHQLQFDAVNRSLDFIKRIGVEHSFNPTTPEDFLALAFPEGGVEDISFTGALGSPPDQLRDRMLQEIAMRIRRTDIEGRIAAAETEKEVADLGNAYHKITGETLEGKKSDFMHELDSQGLHKELIKPIGDIYYKEKERLQSLLINKDGENDEYIQDSVKPEDLEFNKDLYKRKQQLRIFTEPETQIGDGSYQDGKYHHLSHEYKQARANLFNFIPTGLYGQWLLKSEFTEESNAVISFRNRYQTWKEYWSMEKDQDRELTGKVVKKTGWFPANDFIEINEKAGKDDLRNPRYVKLHTPDTPKEHAQLEFYKGYMKIFHLAGAEFGSEGLRFVREGGLINVPNKLIKKASQSGTLNLLKHNAIEYLTALPQSNIENVDDAGLVRQEFRLPFMADVRNIDKVNTIRGKIKDLDIQYQQQKIKKADYRKQKAELTRLLKIEDHKNDLADLETDPVKTLSAYAVAAKMFKALSSIEGEVLSLRDVIAQKVLLDPNDPQSYRKYIKQNAFGLTKISIGGKTVWKASTEVNTIKRTEDLIKNFYKESIEQSTLAVMAKRIMEMTSLGVMGLNIPNNINNTVLYQLNNLQQTIVSRYFPLKNYVRAESLFFTEYIPGRIKSLAESKLPYGRRIPQSKIEWLMEHFHVKTDIQMAQGKSANKTIGKLYFGENFAIAYAQYTMMTGLIMSDTLKNYKTDEQVPMWDAYDWNPNTHECTLKDGFDKKEAAQLRIILKGKDIQTKVQGNFEEINQPMLVKYILGRAVSQFRKYFAPKWNDAFSKNFIHPTLGETEGTWTSVVSLMNLVKDFDGHWSESLKGGWNNLKDYQKKNLYVDAVQMLTLLTMFALYALISSWAKKNEGSAKRWLNFMAYTTSRLRFEQQTFNPVFGWVQMAEYIQNPLAMSQTLKNFAEALYSTAEFPFQDQSERYYKNGVFQGNSKVAEQWKRALPVLRVYHKWMSMDESNDYEASLFGKK